jgi:hypothetical protein
MWISKRTAALTRRRINRLSPFATRPGTEAVFRPVRPTFDAQNAFIGRSRRSRRPERPSRRTDATPAPRPPCADREQPFKWHATLTRTLRKGSLLASQHRRWARSSTRQFERVSRGSRCLRGAGRRGFAGAEDARRQLAFAPRAGEGERPRRQVVERDLQRDLGIWVDRGSGRTARGIRGRTARSTHGATWSAAGSGRVLPTITCSLDMARLVRRVGRLRAQLYGGSLARGESTGLLAHWE